WCQPFDPLDDISAQQYPAFAGEIPRDEQAQTVRFMSNNELAPKAGERNSALAIVDRLCIRLPLREVEFLLRGTHIDPILGEGTVVDCSMDHREFAGGLDGNIVCPKQRIAAAVHFVDR